MKIINKFLVLTALCCTLLMVSCDEDTDVSTVTSFPAVELIEALPSLIIASDSTTNTFTVDMALSDNQIVETELFIEVDVENSTAVLGEDFTLSTQLIYIPGYANEASFQVTILGDILPDAAEEVAFLKIRGSDPEIGGVIVKPENELTIELRITNYTEDGVGIVTDFDQGLISLPSQGTGDEPLYTKCANGLDIDPYALIIDEGVPTLYTFSDDYYACPEEFTGLTAWPDDNYFFLASLFSNPFAFDPQAGGDLCVNSTAVKIGQFLVDLPPSECHAPTDPTGGAAADVFLFEMRKTGSTFLFYNIDEDLLGEINRFMEIPALQQAKQEKRESYIPFDNNGEFATY